MHKARLILAATQSSMTPMARRFTERVIELIGAA